MSLVQKVLRTGKIPAGIKLIFNKPMRTFHIALIGFSTDRNSFMCRTEGKLNNFSKKCFFQAVPRSGKFSTVIGLDRYFSGFYAIVL